MNFGRFVQMRLQGAPIDAPIANDIFGGGGGETVQTNTIQNSDPWGGVQPYLTDIFGRGQTLANRGTYPGQQLGQQSWDTNFSQLLQRDRAMAGSDNTREAQRQNLMTQQGAYLTPDSNPFLKGAVDQALGDVTSKVNSQFRGDNFGNSAHQEWLGKQLAGTALPIYAQNYNTERGRQMQAGAMAPSLAAQDYLDIGQLGAVGAAKDARSQMETDASKQQFNAPWENLFNYQRAIAGSGATGGQTSTSGQQPYFSNPLASALGLGVGGLGLYNGLTQAGLLGGAGALAGTAGTMGTMAGIGGMGLEGALMFSDVRVKENIERVGTHDSGAGLYKYNYIGEDKPQIGVMAQEYAQVRPDAVHDLGGILAVDYGKV
jgi:hypothetical protein